MVEIGFTVVLLLVGFFFGSAREKKHLQELRAREMKLMHRLKTDKAVFKQSHQALVL